MFGGVSLGSDQQKGTGGANFAYALNKYVMPYAEFGYLPGLARKYREDLVGGLRVDGPIDTRVDQTGNFRMQNVSGMRIIFDGSHPGMTLALDNVRLTR